MNSDQKRSSSRRIPFIVTVAMILVIALNILIYFISFTRSEEAKYLYNYVASRSTQVVHDGKHMKATTHPIESLHLSGYNARFGINSYNRWVFGKFDERTDLYSAYSASIDHELLEVLFDGENVEEDISDVSFKMQEMFEVNSTLNVRYENPVSKFEGSDFLVTILNKKDRSTFVAFNPKSDYVAVEIDIANHPVGYLHPVRYEFPEQNKDYWIISDTMYFKTIILDVVSGEVITIDQFPVGHAVYYDNDAQDFRFLFSDDWKINRYNSKGEFIDSFETDVSYRAYKIKKLYIIKYKNEKILCLPRPEFTSEYPSDNIIHYDLSGERIWFEPDDQVIINRLLLAKNYGTIVKDGNYLLKTGEITKLISPEGEILESFGMKNHYSDSYFYYDEKKEKAYSFMEVEYEGRYLFTEYEFK